MMSGMVLMSIRMGSDRELLVSSEKEEIDCSAESESEMIRNGPCEKLSLMICIAFNMADCSA